MKSMLDIESPLSKELKQFLHSAHDWEAMLDLSNSCRKVRPSYIVMMHAQNLHQALPCNQLLQCCHVK